jgi:hypothetical protein
VQICEKAWSTPLVTIQMHLENLHLGMPYVQKWLRKCHTPFVEVVEEYEIYNCPIHHLDHFCCKIERKTEVNQASLKCFSRECARANTISPAMRAGAPYCRRTCHTRFSEENQVHIYMHARIKFHAYSDIKVNTETTSRMKKKDYQRFTLNPGNEGSKHHRQSTGGCVRLAPATSLPDFKAASFF